MGGDQDSSKGEAFEAKRVESALGQGSLMMLDAPILGGDSRSMALKTVNYFLSNTAFRMRDLHTATRSALEISSLQSSSYKRILELILAGLGVKRRDLAPRVR